MASGSSSHLPRKAGSAGANSRSGTGPVQPPTSRPNIATLTAELERYKFDLRQTQYALDVANKDRDLIKPIVTRLEKLPWDDKLPKLKKELDGLGAITSDLPGSNRSPVENVEWFLNVIPEIIKCRKIYGECCASTAWQGAFGVLLKAGCKQLQSLKSDDFKLPTNKKDFENLTSTLQTSTNKNINKKLDQFWSNGGERIALGAAKSKSANQVSTSSRTARRRVSDNTDGE